MRKFGILAIAGLLTAASLSPAFAQSLTTTRTIDEIQALCVLGDDDDACLAAVVLHIAEIKAAGLPAQLTDDLIADLATTLGTAAVEAPLEVRQRIAEVIETAAASMVDTTRSDNLMVAAADLRVVTEEDAPVPASPA
jgi:hypothetical protein